MWKRVNGDGIASFATMFLHRNFKFNCNRWIDCEIIGCLSFSLPTTTLLRLCFVDRVDVKCGGCGRESLWKIYTFFALLRTTWRWHTFGNSNLDNERASGKWRYPICTSNKEYCSLKSNCIERITYHMSWSWKQADALWPFANQENALDFLFLRRASSVYRFHLFVNRVAPFDNLLIAITSQQPVQRRDHIQKGISDRYSYQCPLFICARLIDSCVFVYLDWSKYHLFVW